MSKRKFEVAIGYAFAFVTMLCFLTFLTVAATLLADLSSAFIAGSMFGGLVILVPLFTIGMIIDKQLRGKEA